MLDGWESVMPKDALQFGSMAHYLLECIYKDYDKWNPHPPVADFLEAYQKKESGKIADLGKMEFMIGLAKILIDGHFRYWKEDKKRKWVAAEAKFDVDFNGFRLRGMRDGLYEQNKGLWILETKTTAAMNEDTLTDALAFDFQNLFYILATKLETGREVKGVLYNILRKPSIKQGQKETLTDFLSRLEVDVQARQQFYFNRFQVSYPKPVQERFEKELLLKLNDFAGWVAGSKDIQTYRNERACITKWACEYLPACSSGSMAGYTRTREMFSELKK
jgi:hypothetical protein